MEPLAEAVQGGSVIMFDRVRGALTRRRVAVQSQPLKAIAWGNLWRSVLGSVVATLLARISLTLARIPEPVRYGGLLALVLAVLSILYGLRKVSQWLKTLTVRRSVLILLVAYVIVAVVIALTTTEQISFGEALPQAFVRVPTVLGQELHRGILSAMRFPDDFRFAYTGSRPRLNVPGADPSAEGIVANEPVLIQVPVTSADSPTLIDYSTGEEVVLTSQAKQLCDLDPLSDDSFLSSGTVLITEGPHFRKDGMWWRVRNEIGSAWCPAEALQRP